jgi:hypothetical protein
MKIEDGGWRIEKTKNQDRGKRGREGGRGKGQEGRGFVAIHQPKHP